MANRAYLLNTRILSNNESELLAKQAGAEKQYIEIAEASYRIPVPWMCCFRPEDLRPYAPTRADLHKDDESEGGGEIAYERLVPCTTVMAALKNLQASWPLFEAIALDSNQDPEELALEEWEDALAALGKLPFPYLTVVIDEVVQSEEEHASFVEALRGSPAAVPHLIKLSQTHGDFEVALDAGIWRDHDAAGHALPAVTPKEGDSPDWPKVWRKIGRGRTKSREEDFQQTRKNLDDYARNGAALNDLERAWHPFKIPIDAKPPPFDWEWKVSAELTSYAEALVGQVEAGRAQGFALDATRAQNAFAAEFTAQMIKLHRLLLCPVRRCSQENIQMLPDTVLYTALGLVAGCEEDALRSARTLCAAWRRPGFYDMSLLRPTERFIFTMFAAYLDEPMPPLVAGANYGKSPTLDTLLAGGRWRGTDAEPLKPLCSMVCREHTYIAPEGPFRGLPIGILAMLKLRAMSGLANPEVDHSLFTTPMGPLPARVPFDEAMDELVARVNARMERHGYDKKAISEAVVMNVALPIEAAIAANSERPSVQDTQPSSSKTRTPWWKFW